MVVSWNEMFRQRAAAQSRKRTSSLQQRHTVAAAGERPMREGPLGVVLGGGNSRRMGCDKRTIEIVRDGARMTLLEWAISRVSQCCDRTVLALREDPPADLATKVETVRDRPGISGPLAGVLSAAQLSSGGGLLVLAVDLPGVPVDLLVRICALGARGVDYVAPGCPGRAEPLCAFYGRRAIAELEARASKGQFGLQSLFISQTLEGRWLSDEELGGDPRKVLLNLNAPSDLARFREQGGSVEPG